MTLSYTLTPFFAWLAAGVLKFIVNSLIEKQFAFMSIGYGGLPSNHSAIVSSMAALIAIKDGIGHPAFGVAVTLAFVVMLDASSLRRQISKHAIAINKLSSSTNDYPPLREKMGHNSLEIGVGILVGIGVAAMVSMTLG